MQLPAQYMATCFVVFNFFVTLLHTGLCPQRAVAWHALLAGLLALLDCSASLFSVVGHLFLVLLQ